MRSKPAIHDLRYITISAGIFLLTISGSIVWGQGTVTEARKEDPKAEFEAMKAEWEKVRDRQIEMIQEKEAQLEDMKESLFSQIQAGKGSAAASSTAVLEKKVAELKEANRRLAGEISALRSRNQTLEQGAGKSSAQAEREQLKKEREEFEALKASFSSERQKFFQEMNRQKTKLRGSQDPSENEKS